MAYDPPMDSFETLEIDPHGEGRGVTTITRVPRDNTVPRSISDKGDNRTILIDTEEGKERLLGYIRSGKKDAEQVYALMEIWVHFGSPEYTQELSLRIQEQIDELFGLGEQMGVLREVYMTLWSGEAAG